MRAVGSRRYTELVKASRASVPLLRARRELIRAELRRTPRWRWLRRRKLEVRFDQTVDELRFALSIAGEPPK